MNKRKRLLRESVTYLVLLAVISFYGSGVSFAQQIVYAPRESIIITTLNSLQDRETAIRDSMKEAQLKLAEVQLSGQTKAKVQEQKFTQRAARMYTSQLHSYVNNSFQFTDNVNNTRQKKSDNTYSLTPGARMNFYTSGSAINTDIHLDNSYSLHHPDGNTQLLTGSLQRSSRLERYMLSLKESCSTNYIATPELGIKMDNLTRHWDNVFGIGLGRSFNRLGFDFEYERTDQFYEADAKRTNDGTDETFSFNQSVKLAPKTRLLFNYQQGRSKARFSAGEAGNSNTYDYKLSVASIASAKLTFVGSVEFKVIDNKGGDDEHDKTFDVSLGHRISDRTSLSLDAKRAIIIPKGVDKSGYNIKTTVGLSGNHRLAFNPKFNLALSYNADFLKYPKTKPTTNSWSNKYSYGFTLTYAFRQWLDFNLDYSYQRLDTNYTTKYNSNSVSFKTQARF